MMMTKMLCWVILTLLVAEVFSSPLPSHTECVHRELSMSCINLQNITWTGLLAKVPDFVERLHIQDSAFEVEIWNRRDEEIEDKEDQPRVILIPTLPNLQYLRITNSNLVHLDKVAFQAIPNVEELHFNYVNMTNYTLAYLAELAELEILDLSRNLLAKMPTDLLKSWPVLKELNLQHNVLSEFGFHMFHEASPVRSLDLSHNNVSFVHPESFKNGTSLEKINLQSNDLKYLHRSVIHNISHSTALHLGDNPWECHCGMEWLVEALASHNSHLLFKDAPQIQCASPQDLKSKKLINLSPKSLKCEPPIISSFPLNQSIHFMHRRIVDCNISGYPYPSVYWMTPRGPIVHPDHRYWVPHDVALAPDHLEFHGMPRYFHAAIRTQSNGSLLFENFRYYFDGEYTCIAVNPAGMADHSLNVSITVSLANTVNWTIIWGFSAAGAAFLLGISVGLILECNRRFCQSTKFVPGPDLKYPDCATTYPGEVYDGDDDDEYEARYYDDGDDFYEDDEYEDGEYYYDTSPLQSFRGSPRRSPMKCVTPAELHDADRKFVDMGINIRETLESVRARLRLNMERHVEKMKKGTQHMRQNTHKYMRNVRTSTGKTMKTLRSTSSQYVHKMREGVVMGVEQVKSHVQSMKEMCGPGHMSHTISTVSISTDIDSNRKNQVMKSITYV